MRKARYRSSVLLLASFVPAASMRGQEPERWVVDPTPVVSIGTIDGADEYVLVNPLAAIRLSDGTLVIRNSSRGLFELRYFAESGEHLATASRWGQGPYESRTPLGVFRAGGDSVLVVGEDDRYAVFGPRGERVREGRVGLMPHLPAYNAQLVDPTHLILFKPGNAARMPDEGLKRDSTLLEVFNTQTQVGQRFDLLLGGATQYERFGQGVYMYATPFPEKAHVGMGGGVVWVGDSGSPEISAYRPDRPQPIARVTVPFARQPVTRGDRSRMRDVYAARGSDEDQARWARFARSMDFPELMPWFGHIEVDRAGNLWVQEYEPFWEEGPQRWVVFAPSGAQIAEVELPANVLPTCFRRAITLCTPLTDVFEIGEDYILVPQSDEWGVRYVRVYRLRKPGGVAP